MPTVTVEVDPSEDEIRSAIWVGLRAYNEQHAGAPDTRSFAVFVRDETGAAIGGLHGQLRWGWLYVDNFWLPEALRGQGLGSSLLRAAEQLALEHACTGSNLDTFEFQALPFYERHGYTVFGVLEGYPPGYRRYFLQKSLTPADGPPVT
jgi:GNAT superfamily N-acetyltransferase